jgi:hypothetical protein
MNRKQASVALVATEKTGTRAEAVRGATRHGVWNRRLQGGAPRVEATCADEHQSRRVRTTPETDAKAGRRRAHTERDYGTRSTSRRFAHSSCEMRTSTLSQITNLTSDLNSASHFSDFAPHRALPPVTVGLVTWAYVF